MFRQEWQRDREQFSQQVTAALRGHSHITMRNQEVTQIPTDRICVLAAGPLASDALAQDLQRVTGDSNLAFSVTAIARWWTRKQLTMTPSSPALSYLEAAKTASWSLFPRPPPGQSHHRRRDWNCP